MSETIRQCWAFHRDGARCEHPAGHPGDHVVMKTWTDDDCATPAEIGVTIHTVTKPQPPLPSNPLQEVIAAPLSAATAPPADPDKCIACNHRHSSGPCKCGCYEQIG